MRPFSNKNRSWFTIPFNIRQEMLKKANLLDEKGRLKTKLTEQIKMMVVDQYYCSDERIIIK
jgi:hypothetical protein